MNLRVAESAEIRRRKEKRKIRGQAQDIAQ